MISSAASTRGSVSEIPATGIRKSGRAPPRRNGTIRQRTYVPSNGRPASVSVPIERNQPGPPLPPASAASLVNALGSLSPALDGSRPTLIRGSDPGKASIRYWTAVLAERLALAPIGRDVGADRRARHQLEALEALAEVAGAK